MFLKLIALLKLANKDHRIKPPPRLPLGGGDSSPDPKFIPPPIVAWPTSVPLDEWARAQRSFRVVYPKVGGRTQRRVLC